MAAATANRQKELAAQEQKQAAWTQITIARQENAKTAYRQARSALHAHLNVLYNTRPMGRVPFSTNPRYARLGWIEGPILLMEKRWREWGSKAEAGPIWSVWADHPNKIILLSMTSEEEAGAQRCIDKAFSAHQAWLAVEPHPPMCRDEPYRYDFDAPPSTLAHQNARAAASLTPQETGGRNKKRFWLTLAFAALFTVFYHPVYAVLGRMLNPALLLPTVSRVVTVLKALVGQ